MKIRCFCGSLLNQEDKTSCTSYQCYEDNEFDKLIEKSKSIEEFIDGNIKFEIFWKCNECGRLHFIKHGKVTTYKLEKEWE